MEKGKVENSDVLVVVAALNEEDGIGPTLDEIRNVLDNAHCLVVDGGSMDLTVEIAKKMGAYVIYQSGAGKGDAIACAIEYLIRNNHCPKYIVFIDADFTYPAEYLPEMIRILEENPEVGMVCGNRFNRHLSMRAMTNMFYVGNRLLALIHNIFNGVDLHDPLTGLRVVRWEILKKWQPKSKSFDIEVELNHFVENCGYKIVEIPIRYRPRLGEKKLKFRHGFVILRRILAESI